MPTRKAPARKKPAIKKPATRKPATRKPATRKPATKKPAIKKPAARKPAARKPAARKPPAVKTAGAFEAREEAVYSLAELTRDLPEVPDKEILAFVGSWTAEELTGLGQRISTGRVSTDCARLLGSARDFLRNASEAQREAMPALTDRLLAAALWAARKDEQLAGEGAAASGRLALDQERRQAEAKAGLGTVLRDRDVLVNACEPLIADRPSWVAVLQKVSRKTTDAQAAAQDVLTLAGLLREVLASRDPEVVLRRDGLRLSAARLAEMEARAADLQKAAARAGAVRTKSPITQGQIDRSDGIALVLLRRIIEQFELGHSVDPTIPRLIAIATFRTLFRGRVARGSEPPKPEPLAPAKDK